MLLLLPVPERGQRLKARLDGCAMAGAQLGAVGIYQGIGDFADRLFC
ncbi:hypothetical protein HBJ00_22005, partial [Aeromonas veronii]|nr:hypothetical protein [Aeromonas veronii]